MKENITPKSDEKQSSTGTQIINKPLQLNTVNKGEPTDNVLVYGADNEVKSVPRSEFGGGSQGLDQVLTNGATAVDKEIELSNSFNDNYASFSSSGIQFNQNDKGAHFSNQEFGFHNDIDGGSIRVYPPRGMSDNINFAFPVKPIHPQRWPYILATIDDVVTPGLQEVLNNDAVAMLSSPANTSDFQITADGLVINTESFDGTQTNGFQVNQNGILIETSKNGFQTAIRTYSNPIANTSFEFPVKEEGTYTLATLEDIPTLDSVLPVSDLQSGIVDNTSLQELGGVDKKINGIRIGKGSGTGEENVVVGSPNNLSNLTTGAYNTVIGFENLTATTTGTGNTAVGNWALRANTIGTYNTAVGTNALTANIGGTDNTAVGKNSLAKSTSGVKNTAVGQTSLYNNTTGSNNSFLGNGAGFYNTTGSYNIGLGTSALAYITTSNYQLGLGYGAGYRISGGTENIAIGVSAIGNSDVATNMTGSSNICIGKFAGGRLTTGSNNLLIENPNNGSSLTTGSNNIILNPVGNTTINTGSNNTIIGGFTSGFASADTGLVVIGNGAGVVAIRKEADNRLLAPNLTSALVVSGGATSLVNKAYTDNIGAVDNSTTTALSSATLTSTYPNALSGFRVHCISISSGGLTYEKTSTGWIQYSTTMVTP